MFNNIFYNKSVLITGHTGFKGSWLSEWLLMLGANVTGISVNIPTSPSHFGFLKFNDRIKDLRLDIRDYSKLNNVMRDISPDFVFHLAAQPIVRKSYEEPLETVATNVIGTVNVLDALRGLQNPCVAIIITSDKSYKNVEWLWGYREIDQLGGADPYSASKAAAEILINSYSASFFNGSENFIRIAVGRAGNVIGGGDWAKDRLFPDIVRSFASNKVITIRNPNATRPWQHVLEPISGYLNLAEKLYRNQKLHAEPFNFGPSQENNVTVKELLDELKLFWPNLEYSIEEIQNAKSEAQRLMLDCSKASVMLNWRPVLDFNHTIRMTAEWYDCYLNEQYDNLPIITRDQINEYIKFAENQRSEWVTK